MAVRLSLEPEIVALLKAIQKRIDTLPGITTEKRDGYDVYLRGAHPFLQMEIKRDFLSLDLWMDDEQIEESRSSGIARAHPFLGEDAIKVRFERATDLARVARWIEHSHAYAPRRDDRQKERAEEKKRAEAEALQRAAEEAIRQTEENERREAARKIAEEEAKKQADARALAARVYTPALKGEPPSARAKAAATYAPKKGEKSAKAAPVKSAPKPNGKTTDAKRKPAAKSAAAKSKAPAKKATAAAKSAGRGAVSRKTAAAGSASASKKKPASRPAAKTKAR